MIYRPRQVRPPRVGIIRLGAKSKSANGREIPVNLPYFLMPKPGELGFELIDGLFPEQPTQLRIQFQMNDIDAVIGDFFRLYGKAGMKCKGDGNVGRWNVTDAKGEKTGERDVQCANHGCEYAKSGQCKPSCVLSFQLMEVYTPGVWQLVSHSEANIDAFRFTLEEVRSRFGLITGIPFILHRYSKQIAPDGKAKTSHFVGLYPDPAWSRQVGWTSFDVPDPIADGAIDPDDITVDTESGEVALTPEQQASVDAQAMPAKAEPQESTPKDEPAPFDGDWEEWCIHLQNKLIELHRTLGVPPDMSPEESSAALTKAARDAGRELKITKADPQSQQLFQAAMSNICQAAWGKRTSGELGPDEAWLLGNLLLREPNIIRDEYECGRDAPTPTAP